MARQTIFFYMQILSLRKCNLLHVYNNMNMVGKFYFIG